MRKHLAGAIVVLALLAPSAVRAASFSDLISIGDSLSDGGNVYQATGNLFPPLPYAQRFSNGPVAVEYLAQLLGLPMLNLAFGGATTGRTTGPDAEPNFLNATRLPSPPFPVLPNMGDTFDEYLATHTVDPLALYVVWGGANDFFLAQELNTNPATLVAELQAAAARAIANIVGYVGTLQALGAQTILVPGLPDLGLTPSLSGGPLQAAASMLSAQFNDRLRAELLVFDSAIYFDTSALLHEIVANPAAYGFTNVTEACFDGMAVCDPDPLNWNLYLFWDSVHPTTHAHKILARQWAIAVPEPAVMILLSCGVVAALARRQARRL